MLLFWEHGHESPLWAILRSPHGHNCAAPSLYGAFGDRKQLFPEAVRRNLSGQVSSQQMIRDASSAREAAKNLLLGAAVAFTGRGTPAGYLLAI
jgi:hypothetical protein